tara:strand:- start:247 stop:813 length:567 start_codon:yes stop_codon:yes gene_type:complete
MTVIRLPMDIKFPLYAAIIFYLLFGTSSAIASESELPESIVVSDFSLLLNGSGSRKKFLLVKIYDIALYLPRRISNHRDINKQIPQAFLINIRFDSNKSFGIPRAWREELLPLLNSEQESKLKAALVRANVSDKFRVEYAPDIGTKILLEDELLLIESGYDLMAAFIDVWLGPKPVSVKLASALMSES